VVVSGHAAPREVRAVGAGQAGIVTSPHNRGAVEAGVDSVDGIHTVGPTIPPTTLERGSLMPENLSVDHIELLTTAAVQWRIAIPEASPVPARFRLSGDQTAALLLTLRAMVVEGAAVGDDYSFTAVEWPQPSVQVLKAVHAYEHLCQTLPAWHGSVVQQLLAAVAQSAIERLPGYSDAAWVWMRPRSVTSLVVGIASGWHPEISGVAWYGPDLDASVWSGARAGLVTADAWPALPATLPDRDEVYLLADSAGGFPDMWTDGVPATYRLTWPLCEEFLNELVTGGRS